ncbi:DNA helicase-2 / ATP-dependent DNA helicase PcrA [Marinilactibacillus piezotolerans]|uniref:DNA helicase-2 / ATP-dependent DNA helicase PcrA n=1 Tax=Marinilactibacillus piezotolerans TaxID=258723 RepID=A0A1I4BFH0_9LACT|nr:ATP-dependent helicase [Marinilactibacillus piezotolerans]SFK67544.1 DNA helicase-2 / ATP-dependent DNA helicase PcrA [Marinilactibacillus piezotolerans]
MVTTIVNNIFLVNAPAGSGKTTKIKSMITSSRIKYPNNNILCITYTKRAAEELKKDIESEDIQISTIHSFLHQFLKIYFRKKEIIDLYFEIYNDQIQKSIINKEEKENITRKNQKYIDKFGDLSLDFIKTNVDQIYYNETSYNHLYFGGLSHDDLLAFSALLFDKFPKIRKRVTQKYQEIFIDEYQDTASKVLKMFYDAVIESNSTLYLLGDKMQQIYSSYDGTFEEEFKTLNRNINLETNYRSIPDIVRLLNNIYNDKNYEQKYSKENRLLEPNHAPRVIFTNDIESRLELEQENYPEALLLYLLNQQRFDSIGAGQLFFHTKRLKKYSNNNQPSAVDVMTDNTNGNTDPLYRLLFAIIKLLTYYGDSNLGRITNHLRNNKNIFNTSKCTIASRNDINELDESLNKLLKEYQKCEKIKEFLEVIKEDTLFNANYFDEIDQEYGDLLDVKLEQFRALKLYLDNPRVSTQHGVKGESHDSVFFIAADSIRHSPFVYMHTFLELWTKVDLTLESIESFYYEYVMWIDETIEEIGCKASDINSGILKEKSEYLEGRINELCTHFKENPIFLNLCVDDYNKYLENKLVRNIKKCFKKNKVYAVLSAFRLFYVGCSRARKNLTIFIERSNVEAFYDEITAKLKNIGFDVEDDTLTY